MLLTIKIVGLVIAFITLLLLEIIKAKNEEIRKRTRLYIVVFLIIGLGMAIIAEIVDAEEKESEAGKREEQYSDLALRSERALTLANANLELSTQSLNSLAEVQRISKQLNDSLNHEIQIQRNINETAQRIFKSQQSIQTDTRRLLTPIPDSLAIRFSLAFKLDSFPDLSGYMFGGQTAASLIHVDSNFFRKILEKGIVSGIRPIDYSDYQGLKTINLYTHKNLNSNSYSISWNGKIDLMASGHFKYDMMNNILLLESSTIPISKINDDISIKSLEDLKNNIISFSILMAGQRRYVKVQLVTTKFDLLIGHWRCKEVVPDESNEIKFSKTFIL